MKPDLYALLGVSPDASPEAIAQAAESKIAAARDNNERVYLRHAREVLGSVASRAAYDTKLRHAKVQAINNTHYVDEETQQTKSAVLTQPWFLLLALGLLLAAGAWYHQRSGKKTAHPPAATLATPGVVVSPAVVVVPPRTEAAVPSPAQVSELSPEAVYAKVAPSVVVVDSIDASGRPFARGSGVVTDAQQVVTNCHVVQRAVQIKVHSAGMEYTATSGTSDTTLDLCMLQVANLPAAAVARSTMAKLRVGQTVYAIGAPQGLDQTLSQGLISALREMSMGMVIQTSAAISPGSSGGGLFDSQGRLVGITTFQAKTGQNLNFALPVDWLDTMRTR